MYNFIEIQPCKNNIGALININLNKVNNDVINEIKVSLDEFGVVFFRNQSLDSSSYVQFAKQLGKCADYKRLKGLNGFPEITVVEKKANEKIMFGEGWHTDSSYTKQPPKFTMLYSIKLLKKVKEIPCLLLNMLVMKIFQKKIRKKLKI
jgi:alpha-ketoglutarate-dependent taurine dioxygenase